MNDVRHEAHILEKYHNCLLNKAIANGSFAFHLLRNISYILI